jgi:hypothetical protein
LLHFDFAADIFTDSLTNSILSSWMDATSEIGKIQGLHRSNINIVMKMVLFFKHVGKKSFEDIYMYVYFIEERVIIIKM